MKVDLTQQQVTVIKRCLALERNNIQLRAALDHRSEMMLAELDGIDALISGEETVTDGRKRNHDNNILEFRP